MSAPYDRTIARTLAEITATSLKAARGAGCPWGLAEDASLAVRELESHGLPGVAALAGLLQAPRNCRCSGDAAAPACGIAALAALSDRLAGRVARMELQFGRTLQPLLLAGPLLRFARRSDQALRLSADGVTLTCAPGGVGADAFARAFPVTAEKMTIEACATPGDLRPPAWGSREIAAEDWQTLEALAARTLVPETAQSRARGAGPADSA